VDYTGITNDLCDKHGWAPKLVKEELGAMANEADFIVAHNGNQFDRPIVEFWMKDQLPFRPWIDTYEDVPYPSSCKSVNLIYLNGFHGFCNPYSHRAVFDVCAMLKVLSHYDINVVTANALCDKIVICAEVSFNDKQLAKDKAFLWEGANGKTYHKRWVKKIRLDQLEKYRKECPFPISVLEECVNGNRQ
jgi:DNA polymerase III subunit epsilon